VGRRTGDGDVSRRLDALAADLAAAGVHVERDRPLGPLTTYRAGGPAALFVPAVDHEGLAGLAAVTARHPEVQVLVVGRGSNLLVADAGFGGLAVQLGPGFEAVEVGEERSGVVEVVAGGAASLPVVARRTAAAGLRGFEWAVGVPGSIGGAVRMNAGGHGSDMAAVLVGIHVVDLATGEDGPVAAPDLHLGYRCSAVRPSQVVTSATLRLVPGSSAEAEAEVAEVVRWRREHQPGGANAGSVFTNPEGDSAGRLVDAAGCKGRRVGSAEVSPKHANFIQVDPGGAAGDVVALMAEVRRAVRDRFGVDLVAETRMVGFDDEVVALAGGATGRAAP
jgi:UDP-N-acetylmuramate dehydrogenase